MRFDAPPSIIVSTVKLAARIVKGSLTMTPRKMELRVAEAPASPYRDGIRVSDSLHIYTPSKGVRDIGMFAINKGAIG